jgi:hypothetical protein
MLFDPDYYSARGATASIDVMWGLSDLDRSN